MLPLKSKTCTIISISLLSICFISASFYFHPSIENNLQFLVSIIFCCWSTGGLSLVFSTKIKSAKVRWMLLVINYLFATYFNVLQFLFILFQTF
ncbi:MULTISPECIES: hypothetical protein [Enterococcus]|uniref:hypothetical protein n=1 Tax=Enterococcus sp. C45 TaxID=3231306 RepID=UPI000CF2F184|nr:MULTISPECIES: hypothetical protein [Enterococcus]EGP5266899.1 hypothetical protein [Enterococcus faecium]EGP5530814.1 hypothetical protein [Enterococcus faecium]MCA6755902.1 hypothetical protein [Enterococcus lactis]PQC11365.1 hypothetical protein CUN15_06890 [Enterococcus faecium]ROY68299.1 hypothetical protein EG883_07385 [Enterococcus faecium]